MPVMRDLMAGGRVGDLMSTIPWYTIPGWTTLMTGVGPGTHGLLYWVATDPADYFENRRPGRRFLTSGDIPFPTFWDVAGAAGKRVAVVNMPLTYPAWPVNGTMVTGLLTPAGARAHVSYPEDLMQRFPGYRVDLSVSREAASPDAPALRPRDVDLAACLRELIHVTEGRRSVATALLADAVDLGVVVFVGPDRISHRAWEEQEAVTRGEAPDEIAELVETYYRTLDAAIGALVDTAGSEATVMVVADHGFGPPPVRIFGINGWLEQKGYLRLRATAVQRTVSSRRALRRIARPLARRWKRRRGMAGAPVVDWSRSSAYALRYPHTRMFGVVINRAGVKREGWVQEEDVPDLVGRLRRELEELQDEGGGRVVRRVYSSEELGAPRPGFPELLVEMEPEFFPRDGLRGAPLFQPYRFRGSGLHEPEGIFVVSGPRVRGSGSAAADIADVAPTVLGLLG
ncbi:MAG: alkaline phosphatase family protein, partial [Actinomycetota bacterium]